MLSDKVSFLLIFSCHQLEKQVQREENTPQVINNVLGIDFQGYIKDKHQYQLCARGRG